MLKSLTIVLAVIGSIFLLAVLYGLYRVLRWFVGVDWGPATFGGMRAEEKKKQALLKANLPKAKKKRAVRK